jgi:hypothetical protein
LTPAVAQAGRILIQESAAAAGRTIDSEHFGAMIAYAREEIPRSLVKTLATRRPNMDPAALVPVGQAAIRDTVLRFTDAGISKFVLRPADEPPDWTAELEWLAPLVQELQR